MSTQTGLEGFDLKDWSLIILLVSLAFVFVVVGIALVVAVINGAVINFTGSFDLGQYQAIIIGIAVVAVTLVAQQLTGKNIAAALVNAKK